VLTLEFHGCTVQRSKSLEALGNNGVTHLSAHAIGMQSRHMPPIGLLEVDQAAAWAHPKRPV
jgi:hypothetical protein